MKFQLLQIVPQQLDRETIRQLTTAETKWISKSTNLKTKWLKLITYWPTLQSDEAMFAIAREVEELKHPETDFELSNIPCQLTIRWSASKWRQPANTNEQLPVMYLSSWSHLSNVTKSRMHCRYNASYVPSWRKVRSAESHLNLWQKCWYGWRKLGVSTTHWPQSTWYILRV